jgi:DNA adenine methylase
MAKLKVQYFKRLIMPTKSPLRYPGGKTRAVGILDMYVQQYFPNKRTLLSPFFGGGSFELYLKDKGYAIFANDKFSPLYTFWIMAKQIPGELAERVRTRMPVSKELFGQLRRTIYEITDDMEVASAYYIINRCSFSGSTFCGGYSTQAAEGRLNESALRTLANVTLDNVTFSNVDCVDFLNEHPETAETVVYADPPYYITNYIYGKDGDMHEAFNHELFAAEIKKRTDWIVSYNDCEYIRNLYSNCRIFKASWKYGMNTSKDSSEIIILPPP